MKKLIYFFLLALGLTLVSCKDFLETSSPSQFTSDVMYNSTTYAQYSLLGVYGGLADGNVFGLRLSLNYVTNTDIEFVGADENSYKENTNRGLSNYLGTPANTAINWTNIYRAIERANLCIEGIRTSPILTGGSNSDKTQMLGYLGEALTMRALCYFELVRNWGDVPFKTEPTRADQSNVYLPPTDRDTIYDHIIKDLQEAEGYVPWLKDGAEYSTPERITKGFIKGIMARICLHRAGYSIRNKPGFPTERGSNWAYYYQLANQKCREIMANGGHKLNPSYIQIWKNLCQLGIDGTGENLFEVAMGLGVSGEMGYTVGVRFYKNAKYGYGNNSNVINTSAYYFYSFDSTDLRRDATVAYYMYSNSNQDLKEVFQTNPISYNIAKWDQRWMCNAWLQQNLAANQKIGYGINWVVMRYSDVLLMLAETENALNGRPTDEAKSALKTVRQRAFPPVQYADRVDAYVNAFNDETSFFNAIVDERAWEFGGEGIRKYDLIRWNLLVDKIQQQRDAFQKMFNREAPYDKLPQKLYYKYQADNEIIYKNDINFYGDVAHDTTGYTMIPWLSGASDANKTLWLNRISLYSTGLTSSGVNNRHLFPIATSIIGDSQGYLQNSYGFQ